MNKYQLCEREIILDKHKKINESNYHAGGKAPSDVVNIAQKNGYKELYLRKMAVVSRFSAFLNKFLYIDWIKIYFSIKRNSILLIQTPIRWGNLKVRRYFFNRLRTKKNITMVSLLHDIEPFRKKIYKTEQHYDRATREFEITLEMTDYFIAPNHKMKEYLISRGFVDSKIVELKVFDYLTPKINVPKTYDKSVIFAGNLSLRKSDFLANIGTLGINFDLYGINYDERCSSDTVTYNGAFPSADLPAQLNKGFGLVWDGESCESCIGIMGEYLRWNNPHKLSLYLASGLPVFIWEEAAEANFVKENNVGFLIKSLSDIKKIFSDMTESKYTDLVKNVASISEKLWNGYFTSEALKSVENKIMEVNNSNQ